MSASATTRQPAIFYGHGSPMNTLGSNRHTEAWRRSGVVGPRPRAILAISAHWYLNEIAVTAMARPRTIHDFYGFPAALHAFDYPAPGDPALAERVRALLAPLPVRTDHDRGLDHGTWSVLAHVYPAADVPVVQLSLDARHDTAFHYDLGRRLGALREEGVRIVGSGNAVHHLGLLARREDALPYDWALAFEAQVRDRVLRDEVAQLIDCQGFGEAARLAVPTPEHYLPMLVVLGARRPDDRVTILTEGIESGSIGMLSFALGQAAA
ncbi:MAG: 4,5-DOPA dioxygenase extradiol [Lautropia sp.]|nr:4,5-DOPA dioxygenase extradiol [Lautropia sp.]MCL4701662.1 4,5-DOPA dioxygenase extradiol [Burkholderiaceae bacterium]MDL1906121.1 4,5-DOPA dioxygenase extradiol [Betaproteobacteria bacterium PRO1]RIK91448.1 MAG: 4,5-DOPA dioxygenase extradiol [Burkholderiales bacterium]